ncbi:MAG: hypothetical protein H7318_03265 [Oligoflexus sp.]|nr:hypothetical protein [Oligoflexus sp.]
MTEARKQAWLKSASYDGLWILSPPFFATLFVAIALFVWPELAERALTPFAWLFLVLAIDVSHVYASIYRTVLNRKMWHDEKSLLILVPIVAYVLGYAAYHWDPMVFWRILAYTAVFHFVRQPYGLFMLYKRSGVKDALWVHRLDQLTIYTASLYPLIVWHLDPSRRFTWFLPGDFWIVDGLRYRWIFDVLAVVIFVAYAAKEVYGLRTSLFLNLPKNLVLLGTALSFGFGILYWNSDFAFTVTNVVSHGVAYMGLIWLTDAKRLWHQQVLTTESDPGMNRQLAIIVTPLLFLISLLALAYFEEGLWNSLVWQEYGQFFGGFSQWFTEADTSAKAWIIPLLALPQATHYIWDGFIWRKRNGIKA